MNNNCPVINMYYFNCMIILQGEMDDYKKVYFNTIGAKNVDHFVLKDKLGN